MKTIKFLLFIGVITFALYSFTTLVQKKWEVPAKYKTMKNPTDPKADMATAKMLYIKNCKSCHGAEGLGDGPKAGNLKGDLGDFSSDATQSQTDGELFYKTTFGRDDMPAFDKKIKDDNDRWLIINYVRTLAEK